MIPQPVDRETRNFGKPLNWDDKTMGECGSLSVRDSQSPHGNVMFSEWKPTKKELKALNNGSVVVLGISGFIHPVVQLYVK